MTFILMKRVYWRVYDILRLASLRSRQFVLFSKSTLCCYFIRLGFWESLFCYFIGFGVMGVFTSYFIMFGFWARNICL
jgi:hypothetical protein